jgi:hypothetical protein
MGYRTYIGFITKREYNKIKSLDVKQFKEYFNLVDEDHEDFDDNHDKISNYKIVESLYNFGKYTDFEPPKKSHKPFFKKCVMKEYYEEYDFEIVTKEYLEYLIEYYSNKVRKIYSNMLEPFFDEDDRDTSTLFKDTKHRYSKEDYEYETIGNFSDLTEDQNVQIIKMFKHVKSMNDEWNSSCFPNKRPYSLNGGTEVTTSWKYEYAVFELVNIYKTFDWKRNQMVFYGW